jgi:hypothetical protein
MPKKSETTDRHRGGPGSSHQNADRPKADERKEPQPGQPTNTDRSRVSGGGGERDRHHTHNPATKG